MTLEALVAITRTPLFQSRISNSERPCLLCFAVHRALCSAHRRESLQRPLYASRHTFGDALPVREIEIFAIALAFLLLLARSNILVIVNLIVSLITLWGASTLLSTAGNTPYECFTSQGTYEDNTSGLYGFGFWLVAVIFLSYVVLVIDLLNWTIRKAVAFRAAGRSRRRTAAPASEQVGNG